MDPIDIYYCATSVPTIEHFFTLGYAPSLLFYAYIPIIFVSLLLGFYIFFQNKYSIQAKLLLALSISFTLWIINILLQWIAVYARVVHFSAQITAIFEAPIFILAIYFVYVFLNKKDIPFKLKVFLGAVAALIAILLPTRINVLSFDLTNCQSNVGTLWNYLYASEIISIIYIVYLCIRKYFSSDTDKIFKKQIPYFAFGVVLFLLTFSLSNIFGELTQVYSINLFGPIGMVAFLGLMTYMIVHFKAFNIKLIATQAFVWALAAFIGAQFFFIKVPINFVLTGLTFFAIIIFGRLLIRSVQKEIQQKEEMEKMGKEIERAYEVERKANYELKNLDKVKNQFLMQVQHDLRTPLSTIKGYCDLLLMGTLGKQPKKTLEVVQRIYVVSEEKIRDVNNFLDTTQFQLGKKVVNLKPGVELNQILEDVFNQLETGAKVKNIYLKLQKPREKLMVQADREKLKSALFNVIDNSIKYTQNGGVTISVDNNGSNGKILVIVSDTGIGIPKEKVATLFDTAFERGEQAKKTFAGGRGIGLYLSSQIVKAHNGKIWAESKGEGKGSTFFVELPVDTARPLILPAEAVK